LNIFSPYQDIIIWKKKKIHSSHFSRKSEIYIDF